MTRIGSIKISTGTRRCRCRLFRLHLATMRVSLLLQQKTTARFLELHLKSLLSLPILPSPISYISQPGFSSLSPGWQLRRRLIFRFFTPDFLCFSLRRASIADRATYDKPSCNAFDRPLASQYVDAQLYFTLTIMRDAAILLSATPSKAFNGHSASGTKCNTGFIITQMLHQIYQF